MTRISAADIPFAGNKHGTSERKFSSPSDQSYRFECLPAGIIFEVDRLRRQDNNLTGELRVTINGNFPDAKSIEGGVLVWGDTNFSAVRTRQERANLLAKRSGAEDVDWYGLVEELAIRLVKAERQGEPAVALSDVKLPPKTQVETWTIEGFPILADDPMVLYGDPASGKSYLAIWLCTELARRDFPVLYVDWEGSRDEQRRRFEQLCTPMPKTVYYLRRDRPLVRVIDGLVQTIRERKIRYVVCDSIGFALEGSPLDSEAATQYFAASRRFGCGSLHLAHPPKNVDEGREATIFGSQFFKAGARSAWYVDRAKENAHDEMKIGLYHRKFNGGRLSDPLNYRFGFGEHRTKVERITADAVEELSVNLPMHDRIARELTRQGSLTIKQIADELGSAPNVIRARLSRHRNLFLRTGTKWSLLNSLPLNSDVEF